MKNYNSNKIDSLVSFTETDLRVDSHYRSENFTRSNLGYQRSGNETLIATPFNRNDDLETILFKTNVLNDPEVLPTFTKYNEQSFECPNSKAIFSKKIGKVISTVSNTYELVKHDVILDAIKPNLNFLEVIIFELSETLKYSPFFKGNSANAAFCDILSNPINSILLILKLLLA